MSIPRCIYESCGTILWEEEEKGQEIMDWGLISLLRTVSCSWNGITMISHMKSLHYKVLCASFDRVTDTIWFNNEMTTGSATSVSQSRTHTYPIPPPVPCYSQSICLERYTLIHNKQQFFTFLCISGKNYHTTLSLTLFPGPAQLSVACSTEKWERAWNN